MGKMFNSIISNDIAFYSLIFFLVVFLIIMITIIKKKSKKNIKNNLSLDEINDDIVEKKELIEKKEIIEKKEENEKSKIIIHNSKTDEMIDLFAPSEKSKKILKDIMQETEKTDEEPFSSIDKIMNEIDEETEEIIESKNDQKDKKEIIEKVEEKNVIEEKENDKKIELQNNIEEIKKEESIEKHEQIEFNIDQIIDETEKQFIENKKEESKDIKTLATKMNEIENTKEEVKEVRLEKLNQASKTLEEKHENKSELEKVLEKMQKDLDEQKETDVVALFEQEQEERAIISYKELLEKKDELIQMTTDERFENEKEYEKEYDFDYEKYIEEYNNEENTEEKREIITPIIENSKSTIDISQIKEDNTEKPKKFVTTDFISPVFGRREAELDYPKVHNFSDVIKTEKTNEYDLEATMNLDPIKEKIQQDDAFLSALKEFRKKLE